MGDNSHHFDTNYFRKRGKLFPYLKGSLFAISIKTLFRPKTLLDVGCAKGEFVYFTSLLGIDSYGVDISETAINQVPRRVRAKCRVSPANELLFEDNYFDLVTSFAVMEHIPERECENVIKEMLRVSRKRVLLQICVKDSLLEKNRHYLRDPTHINVKESEWWKDMFKECNMKFREVLPKLGMFVIEKQNGRD
ncbi:class I SAM-dependent methyltransferase [Patescibacteria group bacterium]|nr:class I SAM-dependent methyltransferase [Patescibacteria group bacterium]